ncbi:MAG TPA: decarboxylating NADP(+)-dependent phosphogluconate dehydrogenase, partial [Chlamydiales bacterium]|nr:decarboxylating NADP(+)-dependent phosphogluconate dehydrogenase [Chlamydiales bacterium]
MTADIGLIGLAVMGQNLVLNMADKGFQVAVFNRTISKVDDFVAGPAKGKKIIGTKSLEEFFKTLKRPKRVMFMVKAGVAVDELINYCLPYLQPGDILIDGGNSNFEDTNRRTKALEEKGLIFLGVGISGGEEGARNGPSIMPGGNPDGWPHVKGIFQAIAARADNGEPCCDWVGDDGAGHYVKMVHNGIEYGDMQLIAEAYDLMRRGLKLTVEEIADTFQAWNKGPLNSYLIEITAQVLKKKDTDGKPLVDKILDVAGQKGTGRWTAVNALDLGQPLTLIGEAVFARILSSLKEERLQASTILGAMITPITGDKKAFLTALEGALYASKMVSYAQGFMLMRQAAKEYHWKMNFGSIALMWRGGCIIRSGFLTKIKEAYDTSSDLASLLVAPYFAQELKRSEAGWRKT